MEFLKLGGRADLDNPHVVRQGKARCRFRFFQIEVLVFVLVFVLSFCLSIVLVFLSLLRIFYHASVYLLSFVLCGHEPKYV